MTVIADRQQTLDLLVNRGRKQVDIEYIHRCESMTDAIKLCVDLAPVPEKSVCLDLGVDQAQWSRIKTGQAHFPQRKINELMDICGNEAPMQWLAWSNGYGLVRLQSHVERENDLLKAEKLELEKKLEHFQEFLKLGKTG